MNSINDLSFRDYMSIRQQTADAHRSRCGIFMINGRYGHLRIEVRDHFGMLRVSIGVLPAEFS